jgi:hypothetical protein
MRIDGNSRIGPPAARRPGTGAAAAGSSFAKSLETAAPPPAPALGATTAIEGLLAFQEVEDATTRVRRRAFKRAAEMLERLDELKLGILDGHLSATRLAELAQLARNGRITTQDPQLDEVLGEIELRAAVELAKLQRRI